MVTESGKFLTKPSGAGFSNKLRSLTKLEFLTNYIPISGIQHICKAIARSFNKTLEIKEGIQNENLANIFSTINKMENIVEVVGLNLAINLDKAKLEQLGFKENKSVLDKIEKVFDEYKKEFENYYLGKRDIKENKAVQKGIVDASRLLLNCMSREIEFKKDDNEMIMQMLNVMGIKENILELDRTLEFQDSPSETINELSPMEEERDFFSFLPIGNNTSSVEKSNAFNQRHNPNYEFNETDVLFIGKNLLSSKLEKEELEFVVTGLGHSAINLKAILENKKYIFSETQGTEKKLVGVHNPGNLHWVVYVIFKYENKLYAIYKDSLGCKIDYDFKEAIINVYTELGLDTSNIFNIESTEQFDNKSCGVFALKNAELLANKNSQNLFDEFYNNQLEFFKPGVSSKEYKLEIANAREELALNYAREAIEEYKSKNASTKLSEEELKEILNIEDNDSLTLLKQEVLTAEEKSTISSAEHYIVGKGSNALAHSLALNHNLNFLNLKSNNIGDVSAKSLAEALKENRSLTSLNLIGNNISEEICYEIENYARDRSALKEEDPEMSLEGEESKIEKESDISEADSDIAAEESQKPTTLEESSYSQTTSFPLSSEAELTTTALSKGEDTMEASNSGGRQLTASSVAADSSKYSPEKHDIENELQDTIQHVKFILNYLGDYKHKQAVASYVYMNLEGIKVKGGEDYYHKVLDERFSSEEKEKLEELKPHLERAMRESGKSFEELYQSLKGRVKEKLEEMIGEEKKEKEEAENREASIQEKIDIEQEIREKNENERDELLRQVKLKFEEYGYKFEELKNKFEKLTDSSEATEIFNQFKNLEAKIPPWVFKNSKFLEENSLPRIDTIISEIYQLKIVKELSDFKQIKTNIKEIKDSAQILKQYAHNSDTQEEKTLMQKHLTELEQIVPKFMWLNVGIDSEDSSEQYQISEKDFELTPIGEEQGEYSE